MALFRYPGCKGKVSKVISTSLAKYAEDHPEAEYREPFFGAGGIGFELLKNEYPEKVWFNDRDLTICAVWNSIYQNPEELKERLEAFTPSVDAYFEFKEFLLKISEPGDLDNYPLTEIAFKKIACHQMSYSGLGTKAGGPIGGVGQKSNYGVGCRYSVKTLFKNIAKIRELIQHRFTHQTDFCTALDFEEVIHDQSCPAFLYLDPPYYEKGPDLYQFSFDQSDHERLAVALKGCQHPWLLSYDDHPEVVRLYEGWAVISTLNFTYTINAKNGGVKKRELLIGSPGWEGI
jgi:DNA adenine methylase